MNEFSVTRGFVSPLLKVMIRKMPSHCLFLPPSPALHTGHTVVSVVERVEVIKAVLTKSVRACLTAAHEAAYTGHSSWNGRFEVNKTVSSVSSV